MKVGHGTGSDTGIGKKEDWRVLPVEHIGNHLDFRLCGSNLLCRGHLGGTAEEERHGDGILWSVIEL